jgi:hypothetical protein
MRQVFADNMAAGRPIDVADKEDIHWEMLARAPVQSR